MAEAAELASRLKTVLPGGGYSAAAVKMADQALNMLISEGKRPAGGVAVEIESTPSTAEELLKRSPRAGEIDKQIAIVGYSCILPGGENVNATWDMIQAGVDTISDIPADRVDVSSYYNPDKTVPDKIYCKRGGFIPNFDFDPREFNFNMLQMEDTDVNQTLSLLKVKEALEDAKIDPNPGIKKNIGCVLGCVGGGMKVSGSPPLSSNFFVPSWSTRLAVLGPAIILTRSHTFHPRRATSSTRG